MKISMTHLLIVDDEKDIVDICQTYFEYEGYQVTTTTCGKEALKLLSSDIDIMSDHFVTTNNIFIYIYLLYDFGSFFLQIHQRKTATYASTNL